MQLDFWTKAVFTLMALSLAVIAWKLPMSATSYAQISICGGMSDNPCYISTGTNSLSVSVLPRSAPDVK